MRRIPLGLPLLLLAGCVPTTNPNYLPEDVVFVEALVGEWEGLNVDGNDKNPKLHTFAKGKDKAYQITEMGGQNYPGHLFRIGEHWFADVQPGSDAHLLLKVSLVGDQLEMSIIDPGWLKRLVNKDPKAVEHEREGGLDADVKRLTASSKDLRAFAAKYVEDANAFGKLLRFTAKKPIAVADAGFGSKKHRTCDYWYEVCMSARSTFLNESDMTNESLVRELQRITKELQELPRDKGIDAEAAECGKAAAATYEAILKKVEGAPNLPSTVLNAFRRDVATDRLGAVAKLVEDKALKEQIDTTFALFEKTRETLNKRHAVKLMGLR